MELSEMFKDRPPKEQAEILEMMDLLRDNPRVTFGDAAKEMGLAVSTAYDRWKKIRDRLKMTVSFEPRLDKLPLPALPVIKCPECRSLKTEPQFISKDGFGMQIVGLVCTACGNKARRSQLPKSAIAAVELAAVGGKI